MRLGFVQYHILGCFGTVILTDEITGLPVYRPTLFGTTDGIFGEAISE